MKKMTLILIAALVLCFIVPNTFAQNVKGVLAGVNMANVSGDDVEIMDVEPSSLMGLAGGLFMVKPLNDNMGFRPEFLYSQNGAKWEEGDGVVKVKAAYLALPLLLQYAVSTEGNIKPILLVGPYLAMNLSAKMVTEFDGEEISDDDIKDDIKSLDYGLVVGGGVVINDKFEITARYIMGLTTVDDTDAEADMKNKTIQILAGIRL